MGLGKQSKTQCRFQDLSDSICKRNGHRAAARMFDVGESSMMEWEKNEMTIINMPKKKCALRKGVTKWPILEESVANWVLENRLNGLIVTRNCVRLFVLKWSKKNIFSCYPTMKVYKVCYFFQINSISMYESKYF
ncbi:HTH CENPB-type domain-containing protein [Trichonephila clavipes]|nr:HTH CENPB-type domain-containing protein [Trichonephila clavipes]